MSPVVCVPLPRSPPPPTPYRLSVKGITQVHMNNSWFLSIARSSAECLADIICQSDVADIRKHAACRLVTSMLKGSGFSLGQGTSRVFSSCLHRRHHPDFCPVQLQKSFCKCMLLFYHMVPHPSPHTPSPFFLFFCHVFKPVFGHLSVMLSTLYICFLPRLSFPHTH